MAVSVVQGLEPVEVEHDQGERPADPGCLRELALEFAHERTPVRQLRQGIVVGEIAHLLELRRQCQGARRLVGEDSQRL